jgi:hypothetical protein
MISAVPRRVKTRSGRPPRLPSAGRRRQLRQTRSIGVYFEPSVPPTLVAAIRELANTVSLLEAALDSSESSQSQGRGAPHTRKHKLRKGWRTPRRRAERARLRSRDIEYRPKAKGDRNVQQAWHARRRLPRDRDLMLDIAFVNTALPHIASDLNAGLRGDEMGEQPQSVATSSPTVALRSVRPRSETRCRRPWSCG